jgi:phosphoglycerate dehydrogenase-like enzyme
MKLVYGMHMGDAERGELEDIAEGLRLVIAEGRERVLEEIAGADAYVPGPWDAEVLAAAPGLRWVHFMWAGIEGQIFSEARGSDVVITNSAGVFGPPMADHILALMLAFARRLNVCTRRSAHDLWHVEGARQSVTDGIGELHGATLGIVGYGGIGRETAKRAKAFGMRVIALKRNPGEADDCADLVLGPDRLDELLAEADYVAVCCALTEETRGMIGRRELALMKATAVIVNVARGAVIDQDALIEALREGRIGGAGLDVTSPEPLPEDSPLWGMENVIITPHVAGASPQTRGRQFALLKENVRRFAAGEDLLNVVDRDLGY